MSTAALSGWLGEAWATVTNSWADDPVAGDGTRWSCYNGADGNKLKALAANFLVTGPGTIWSSDPEGHAYFLLEQGLESGALLVSAQAAHGTPTESELLPSQRFLESFLEGQAPGVLSAVMQGAEFVNFFWSGEATRKLVALLYYAHRVAMTGMEIHAPNARVQLLAAGKMTAKEIERDYLLRAGIFQSIKNICTTSPFSDLLMSQSATSGVGAAPVVAIGVVVAVAVAICALAFTVVSIYSVRVANKLLADSLKECEKTFSQTGQESQGCIEMAKGAAVAAKAPELPSAWQDKAVLYSAIIVGGGLILYFLPTVVTKIMDASQRYKAAKTRG